MAFANLDRVKFVYLGGGDYVGVYLLDTLIYSGHSIDGQRLLELLGAKPGVHYTTEESDNASAGQPLENFGDYTEDSFDS